MTGTEVLVIVCGLAIGYWFVAVFLPNAQPGAPAQEKDAEKTTTIDIGVQAWHEVLGVAPDADREAVHAAYRRHAARFRADQIAMLAPEMRALAQHRATELDIAYDRALMALHDSGR